LSAFQRAANLARAHLSTHLATCLALTALNLSISWRLMKVEYTGHFISVEGYFIAIARYISGHWGDFSWFPLWHCGMPYADTYVPLLHLLVAATASLGHISAARAYHGVTGVTYALGAPALYWMAVRLGAPRGAALLSALGYSLFSPSTLLMANVVRDLGGYGYGRRLQVLTAWGEGPHVTAMTLLPVVILALQNALVKRTGRAMALAALSIALVFLTNIPGSMALAVAVFCWICAQPRDRLRAAWRVAATASALAYGVACFGVPPSSMFRVGANVGDMHRGFSNSLHYGPLPLLAVLGAVAAAGFVLAGTRLPLTVRFAILFGTLTGAMAATARSETFELLPQVGRLHLEFEMGASLLLGCAAWALYTLFPRWTRPVLLAIYLGPLFIQWGNYRERAHGDILRADLEKHSEYTSARWLDANLHGGRVYVTGSTAFWLNAFTTTPQLIGCCDQGQSMPVLNEAPYKVNTAVNPAITEEGINWLRALGVQAMVVNGPTSTDEYKDIRAPERFDGVLPLLHRENGDSIYSVLPLGASLAHVVRPEELVPHHARGNFAYADILKYAQATVDAARPPATFEWRGGGRARIHANLHPDDVLSVQVAWFPGWKATVHGERVAISADGMGFIVIQPRCQGDCVIDLAWTGRGDLPISAAVSLASLGLLGFLALRARVLVRPPGDGRKQ
jgi:hypothetical protein